MITDMFLRILLYCSLYTLVECYKVQKCLTGYMTDVQTWVDEKGVLTMNVDYDTAIDLSANSNPVPTLQQRMTIMRSSNDVYVKYLSLARCRLSRVPTVFQFKDSQGRDLAEAVEYMTFFGNNFRDISAAGEYYDVEMNATQAREMTGTSVRFQKLYHTVWSTGFEDSNFPRLKQLDLRSCGIQVLNGYVFSGMLNLEALYIGENEISSIDADAFVGLTNLVHLDLSRNQAYDEVGDPKTMTMEAIHVFEPLRNLASLDFSYTKLLQRHLIFFKSFSRNLTRLSLCGTELTSIEDYLFNQTSLRILDVSVNYGILSRVNSLGGLENTLEVLYANDIGLRSTEVFRNFANLEILDISLNEISAFSIGIAKTLRNLKVLYMNMNRVGSWFDKTYSLMPKLNLLSLKDNNINIISENMIKDIAKIDFVALSGNFIVCNCHTRDFFDLALRNEQIPKEIDILNQRKENGPLLQCFHNAFKQLNDLIIHRDGVVINCTESDLCYDLHEGLDGNFVLLDYHPSTYMCLLVPESKSVSIIDVVGCNRTSRDMDYEKVMTEGRNMLYILLALPVLLGFMAFGFVFRRNFKYCFITVRNSALLSLINKNDVLDVVPEDAIFHYDVFVSYCNEDRAWVLDHLLPHLEADCCIRACLHERDFQVGHSILENIVSSMDRSRSIMLIISQGFLLSQWCQFEMHLAQHRLLETRREDLTLVLLEEIPRRLRPNTLHYLMLTKTYIVWPKEECERILFWKRLKKSLISLKQKHNGIEGVSLA